MKALGFSLAVVVGLLSACSDNVSSTGRGGSGGDTGGGKSADGGVVLDPASCGSQPKSQAISQACCMGFGVDACGAGLFCAAFDGRTQPTCYAEHSRLAGEECSSDDQCVTLGCNTDVGKCEALPETECKSDIGCANDPAGNAYVCGSSGRCSPRGHGLRNDYCAASSDCQADVGLACDLTSHECQPENGDEGYCQEDPSKTDRYEECVPTGGGEVTHACAVSQDENGQAKIVVGCPSGSSCEDVGASFYFCGG